MAPRPALEHLDLEALLTERTLTTEVLAGVEALPPTAATERNLRNLGSALDLVEEELDRREAVAVLVLALAR